MLIGIASTGVHSNGFSLVRKIVADNNLDLNKIYPELSDRQTLGEVLLTPTKIYVKPVLDVVRRCNVHGISHITGGGFYENIPRALPEHMGAEVNDAAWEMPPIFQLLQEWGNVDWPEMYRTFNMGIGMVLIASPEEAACIEGHLQAQNEVVYRIGRVTEGGHEVVIKGGVFDA